MKLSALRILILCALSGACSAFSIHVFPKPSFLPSVVPGIYFGVFLLVWLPGVRLSSLWKRVLIVLASGAIYFSAIWLAVQIASMKLPAHFYAYAAAGALGGLLLRLSLVLIGAAKRSWAQIGATVLAGSFLGLVFQFEPKNGSELLETALFSVYFFIWQAGVGLLLFRHSKAAELRS